MRRKNVFPIAAVAVLVALAVSGCDKLSQVGRLTQPPPTASAATVAQPFTASSGGIQTTVRSGADVVLTGTSSQKGTADNGVPIIKYVWTQQSADALQVDLVRRTVDTVSFTAPQVTAETKLNFQLAVSDANGQSSTTTAVVTVEPVRDSDHFLQFLTAKNTFAVTAVTNVALPAAPGASATATLPFTITVQKLVSFIDINGVQQSMVPIGAPVTYSGGWSSALGNGGANCNDARNPEVQIPIPTLNLDDELADGSARLSDVLELSDVDQDPPTSKVPPAVVSAKISIQSSALPGGTTAAVCVNPSATSTATSTPLVLSAENLNAVPSSAAAPRDDSESAHAYYATIDPTNAKTTLNAWLTANGFSPAAANYGADAHAVYTNNFDLGLGRDMYLKMGACDNGASALPLQQRLGKCDLATVVVNYASVQAAGYRLNPIVAVAMEYSAVAPGGPRFVKFYTFAPDTRTGALDRVASVDLDHRGQRPLPQACVVCHGGVPGTIVTNAAGAKTYSNNGNLGSGWLSWDLDSFYFTDTDPGFSTKSDDAALKAQYTRSAQEPQFKLLNSATYLTLDDPQRFALEKELIEGWYGGPGLPNATFSGSYVPPEWMPGGTGQNPAGSDKIYTDVFAHNCRACHVLQQPQGNIDPRTATGSDGANNTVSACSAAATSSAAASAHQVPMGCFWEFANARNLAQRLTDGTMPFARRTADRLWVDADGSPSPGIELQKYLAAQAAPQPIQVPGTSVARVVTPPQVVQAQSIQQSVGTADIGNALLLDGTASAFPDSVVWSAAACSGTPLAPGQCARALPVVGSTGTLASVLLDDAVTYRLTMTLDGGTGLATSTQYVQVPVQIPTLVANQSLNLQVGASQAVQVYPTWISGWGNGGPAHNTVLLQLGPGLGVDAAAQACVTAPGCSGTTAAAGIVIESTGNVAQVSSIGLTVTGEGSKPGVATETIPVNLVASVTAPSPTLSPVTANTTVATTYNILAVVNPTPNTYPNCASVSLANVHYTGPRTSVVTFDGVSMLSYTPQAGFATYSSTGVAQTIAPETIAYTLQCTLPNSSVETSNGVFTVPVQARVAFASVQQVWETSADCSSCHGGSGNTPATNTAPPLGNPAFVTYADLLSWNANNSGLDNNSNAIANLSIPLVNLSSVNDSALLCWPNDSCVGQVTSHTGGYFCVPSTPTPPEPPQRPITATGVTGSCTANSELNTVLEWIQDGANDF